MKKLAMNYVRIIAWDHNHITISEYGLEDPNARPAMFVTGSYYLNPSSNYGGLVRSRFCLIENDVVVTGHYIVDQRQAPPTETAHDPKSIVLTITNHNECLNCGMACQMQHRKVLFCDDCYMLIDWQHVLDPNAISANFSWDNNIQRRQP